MGCFSSKNHSKNSKQDEGSTFPEDEGKNYKLETMDKVKEYIENGKNEDALEKLLDACDYDIGQHRKETDFVYDCYIQIAELYLKFGDQIRSLLYILRVYYYSSWRNNINPDAENRKKMIKCAQIIAKIFLKKDKPLKAKFILETSSILAEEDAQIEEINNSIKNDLEDEDNELLEKIKNDLNKAEDLVKKKKVDTDESINIYKEVANKLVKEGKPSEANFFFIKALDFYTIQNQRDSKYGKQIGQLYLQQAEAAMKFNKYNVAIFFSQKATLLIQDEKLKQESEQITEEAEKNMSKEDKDLDKTLKEEKKKYSDAILKSKTENNDVFYSYLYYGASLIDQEKPEQALAYLKRCLYFYSYKSFNDEEFTQLVGETLTLIGRAYKMRKKYIKAQFHVERAIPLLKEPEKSEAAVEIIEINNALSKEPRKSIMSLQVRRSITRLESNPNLKNNNKKTGNQNQISNAI